MSDPLSMAVWRAKISKQTPQVVNIVQPQEAELTEAKKKIAELENLTAELKGRIGGLTTELNRRFARIAPVELPPTFIKISEVAGAVSREFKMSVLDMQSERRTRDASLPRQIAMHLARKLTNRSFPTIAKFFGNRDHTTAMHANNKICEERARDPVLNARLQRLERILVGSSPSSMDRPGGVTDREAQPLGA